MTESPAYHHGNLQQALVEAGAQLIEENGISGISLREVAKIAGVSHSAPYRHFKDKNALLTSIAEVGFQRLGHAMQLAVEQHPGNAREQLIEAGVAYIRLALDNSEMFHLMFGGLIAAEDPSEALQQSSVLAFQGLVLIIQGGQKDGLYKQAEANELALTAWSLVHGYAMLASTGKLHHMTNSRKAILSLARYIESHLIDGIAR